MLIVAETTFFFVTARSFVHFLCLLSNRLRRPILPSTFCAGIASVHRGANEVAVGTKKLGRPTKPAVAGERAMLGLRVRAEIKEALEKAAEASGRSQSQEAEFRL